MKLFKLRQRAGKEGLVILPHGDNFLLTDEAVKNPLEIICKDLEELDERLTMIECPCCRNFIYAMRGR